MFYDKQLRKRNPISHNYITQKNISDNDDLFKNEEEIDEAYTSKYIYECEILSAFDMDTYDDKILNDKIYNLYNYFSHIRNEYPDIHNILNLAEEISLKYLLQKDEIQGFMILFSFDFFHITHICICDIFNNEPFGFISCNNLEYLNKIINF